MELCCRIHDPQRIRGRERLEIPSIDGGILCTNWEEGQAHRAPVDRDDERRLAVTPRRVSDSGSDRHLLARMPNPYPIELRERAVRAYENGDRRLVFLDESGPNLAMGRSHVWPAASSGRNAVRIGSASRPPSRAA